MITHARWVAGTAVVVSVICATALGQTHLNVSVLSSGSSTVEVDPGATVDYQVEGVLSGDPNEGLALVLFDLRFTGGDLAQANTPTTAPMNNFVYDPANTWYEGISNPGGYGGTVIGGDLVHVCGAQNTIMNDVSNAPFPVGQVITGVAQTQVELVTGSLTAPDLVGAYTLSVRSLAASVIRAGEDGSGTFWATDLAGEGSVSPLTINVLEPACPPADPPTQPAGEAGYEKVRYISMEPGNPGRQTALRVHLKTLPPPFDGFNDTKCWVGEPQQVSENSGKINHEPGWPDFMSANLQGSPHCMDWSTVGALHVTDDDIIPSALYEVQAIDCTCDFENEANYSAPLTITTSKWGDLVGHCAVIPCSPPEGVVNMATDVTACLDKFRNLAGAVMKSRADIEPNFPDWLVNISDVTYVLDAFRGFAYPAAQTPPAPGWPGPDGCP